MRALPEQNFVFYDRFMTVEGQAKTLGHYRQSMYLCKSRYVDFFIAETRGTRMDKEKSIFEQMGGTYTEKDGILYPNLLIGNEETEAMQDIFSGKYGDLWKKYLKENQSGRYHHLVRTGQLKQEAVEVNDEVNELLDRIMQQYLQKHKPENPDSTMEMWRLREQAKAMAEEVVLHDIVYCYH